MAGVLLFGVAVAYWLYSYVVAFAVPAPAAAGVGGPLIRNMTLFALFGLHHSVFARSWAKQRIEQRWPLAERRLYVIVSSLLLMAVCWAWAPLPGTAWRLTETSAVAVQALRYGGVLWLVAAGRMLDASELVGLRPASPPVFRADGPYGWVRHPLYTGLLVTLFAAPTMTYTQLLFAGACGVYVLIGMHFEERALRRDSAGAYQSYAAVVRWRLLPFVF